MKSLLIFTSFPRCIFCENFSGSSRVCLADASRLLRFGKTLSSIITADTPSRSSFLTKNSNCEGDPPVSPSTIMGLVETFSISSIV